jgi:hypothetical protein
MSGTLRHLAITSGAVLAALATFRALWPDPDERALHSCSLVLTLGYGHLIGGLLGGWRAFQKALPGSLAGAPGLALVAAAVPLLLELHAAALAHWPALSFLLLALSTWHMSENESALARAGGASLGPVRLAWQPQCIPLAVGAIVVLLAAAALAPGERLALGARAMALPDARALGVHFGDVFVAATLFHLVSWLHVSLHRRTRLALCSHLSAAALGGAALLAPGDVAARAREVLFSPGLYLFWSALHVVQTWIGRGSVRR